MIGFLERTVVARTRVAKMRMFRWMNEHILRYKIQNEDINKL